MEATRWNFGEYKYLQASSKTGEAYVSIDNKYRSLSDDLHEIPSGDTYPDPTPESGAAFEIGDFGDRDRLSWATGACSIPQNIKLIYAGSGRFAMWHEDDTLVVVDTARAEVLRLTCRRMLSSAYAFLVHAGTLWISGDHGVMSLSLAALEALFAQPPGPFEIRVRESYPARNPKREIRVLVVAIADKRAKVYNGVMKTIEIPAVAGLEERMEVTLRDLLWANLFMQVELPDGTCRTLYAEPDAESMFPAELAREPAIDPAGDLAVAPDAPSRQAEIDRLLGELTEDPDDVASRSILVDAFEDAGEPYAPLLAALVAGETDPAVREKALGPFGNYLDHVEYRGGLPWSATLKSQAPRDETIGAALAADQRLGLFHALRLGDGPFDVYANLVGSPRAVGLRHVDVPNKRVLGALIAGGRNEVTHLYNVKFSTRDMIEQLAHTTFDRVTQLETETTAEFVDKLFAFITRDEHKIFARAPRQVVLRERAGQDHALVPKVLAAWDRLPVDAITFDGVTLRRDGARTRCEIPEGTFPPTITAVRGRFPG